MVKKALSIVLLTLFCLISANAQPGTVDGLFFDYHAADELSLIPETPFNETLRDSLSELDPNLGIEALFELPGIDGATWEEQRLELYRILQSISTMEGIEYYSASRERMREFYLESYVVAAANDRTRLPDPVPDSIPSEETLYAFQRDSSFGRNVQKLTYRSSPDAFYIEIVNQTQMFYSLIPLVGPERLKVTMLITPSADGLLFYGNLGVRVPSAFGMEEKARDSFRNRIIALYRWFDGRVESER